MRLPDKFKTNILIQLWIVVCYLLLMAPLQIILTSVCAFFHFELNHTLGIIEQWLFYRAHTITIIIKITAAYIVLQFVNLSLPSRHPWRELLQKKGRRLHTSELIIAFFIWIFVLYFGHAAPSSALSIDLQSTLISYLGTSVYYIVDLVVLFSLNRLYPLKREKAYAVCIFLGVFQLLISKWIYPYAFGSKSFILASWLIISFFTYRDVDNWGRPLFFVLLVFSPLSSFFGVDPLWADQFSFFVLKRSANFSLSLSLVLSVYFFFRLKEIPRVKTFLQLD